MKVLVSHQLQSRFTRLEPLTLVMKQNTSRSIRQLLWAHTNNHVYSSIVLSDLEFSGDGVGYVTLKNFAEPTSPPTPIQQPRRGSMIRLIHLCASQGEMWNVVFIMLSQTSPFWEDICIYTLLGRRLQYCANENATPDLHLDKEKTSHQTQNSSY